MDKLIKSILQIESDAQNIVADAKARAARFDEDCAEKRAEMEREIMDRCERHIEKMHAREEQYRTEQIQNVRIQEHKSSDAIEEAYKNNKQEWVSRLFGNITGGE